MLHPSLKLLLLAERQSAKVEFYNDYVRDLEIECDHLSKENRILRKKTIKTQDELNTAIKDRDRYREMAQKFMEQRDKLRLKFGETEEVPHTD